MEQMLETIATITVLGTTLTGFWAWTRKHIISLTAQLPGIQSRVAAVEKWSNNHHQEQRADMEKVFGRLEALQRSVARIEGKLD